MLSLGGVNTFSGTTSVTAGTLTLETGGALASGVLGVSGGAVFNAQSGSSLSASTVLTADGLVNLFASGVTIETLLGGGSVNLNTTELTVSNGAFSGAINGTGSLLKSGAGELSLSGVNTYTGNTSVTGGMLTLSGTLASTVLNVGLGAVFNGSLGSSIPALTALQAASAAARALLGCGTPR